MTMFVNGLAVTLPNEADITHPHGPDTTVATQRPA